MALPCLVLTGCHPDRPTITFTQVPPASPGGPESSGTIAGRVSRFKPNERMVLYSNAGTRWWVQPYSYAPYTAIQPDGTWSAQIHLGLEYGAALVAGNDSQARVTDSMPKLGGGVMAVATVPGTPNAALPAPSKVLHFGGYDWDVRTNGGAYGGENHPYDPENVWLDDKQAMHLRLTRQENQWVCGEAHVQRTLGYGTYRLRIRNVGQLEPAAMLSLFTWTDTSADQHHREMDIHISRWGDPENKSAEYVIQPYYLPANAYRFEIPPGPVETSFRWTPGSVAFTTSAGQGSKKVPEAWTVTTGIPTSSDEKTYINLCEFGYSKLPLQHEAEVVIEQFQFLP